MGLVTQDMHPFQKRVQTLLDADKPVKVHVGSGPVKIPGMLDVDVRSCHGNFQFDCAERWPCPDSSVDYIFHEDLLEHLTQRNQFRFLAETMRVMKPGAVQHVSTPDLAWAMSHSQWGKGCSGVYEEWRKWGHHLVHTEASLLSMVEIVGFEARTSSRRPFATRPGKDRDQQVGNLYLDLVKPKLDG
jgi:predicted SAM-dependent methyltransferase